MTRRAGAGRLATAWGRHRGTARWYAVASAVAGTCLAGCGGSPTHSATGARPTPAPSAATSGAPSPTAAAPSSTAPASHTAAASATPPLLFAAYCAPSQLQLSPTGTFSGSSGRRTMGVAITNVSSTGCHLDGYPGVSFLDASGRVLPFISVWGPDPVLTSARPDRVDIAPGAQGTFTVDRSACSATPVAAAATVSVIPPNDATSLKLAIPSGFDFCGPGDPGSTVYVSPVEATTAATLAHP